MKKKNNFLGDIAGLIELLPERKRRIERASPGPIGDDPINELARSLHPQKIYFEIAEVRDETPTIRTFKLVAAPDSGTTALPVFRAGQYLAFREEVQGVVVTRPYSISSSPREALEDGFMEITVRKIPKGFLTKHIWKNWKPGSKITSSGPAGFFYHEPLRDTNHILGIAGGCGFTPFRSMIKDAIDNDLDLSITLLFGIRTPDEVIFKKELAKYKRKMGKKLKVTYVCSEPDGSWKGPSGFITKDVIKKQGGGVKGKTLFICGPPAMYRFLENELAEFKIPQKRIRREVFGEIDDITAFDEFPRGLKRKKFNIKVHIGSEVEEIQAKATETVLVAMERAGLAPQSKCRSGECGFCDSLLLDGEIFVSPENDGRRMAGVKFNHFHPCASYPVTDLEIIVNRSV